MNLFGKRLDDNEKVYSSLSKIKGISSKATGTALDLCLSLGIGSECKVKDVPSDKWSRIAELLSSGSTGGREVAIQRELKMAQIKPLFRSEAIGHGVRTEVELAHECNERVRELNISTRVQEYRKASRLGGANQELIDSKLQKFVKDNIEKLQKTRSYRGLRHLEGLPCRGQRTHTNGGSKRRKVARSHSVLRGRG